MWGKDRVQDVKLGWNISNVSLRASRTRVRRFCFWDRRVRAKFFNESLERLIFAVHFYSCTKSLRFHVIITHFKQGCAASLRFILIGVVIEGWRVSQCYRTSMLRITSALEYQSFLIRSCVTRNDRKFHLIARNIENCTSFRRKTDRDKNDATRGGVEGYSSVDESWTELEQRERELEREKERTRERERLKKKRSEQASIGIAAPFATRENHLNRGEKCSTANWTTQSFPACY